MMLNSFIKPTSGTVNRCSKLESIDYQKLASKFISMTKVPTLLWQGTVVFFFLINFFFSAAIVSKGKCSWPLFYWFPSVHNYCIAKRDGATVECCTYYSIPFYRTWVGEIRFDMVEKNAEYMYECVYVCMYACVYVWYIVVVSVCMASHRVCWSF